MLKYSYAQPSTQHVNQDTEVFLEASYLRQTPDTMVRAKIPEKILATKQFRDKTARKAWRLHRGVRN